MKKQFFRAVSAVLTILMVCSMMIVGIGSANAATLACNQEIVKDAVIYFDLSLWETYMTNLGYGADEYEFLVKPDYEYEYDMEFVPVYSDEAGMYFANIDLGYLNQLRSLKPMIRLTSNNSVFLNSGAIPYEQGKNRLTINGTVVGESMSYNDPFYSFDTYFYQSELLFEASETTVCRGRQVQLTSFLDKYTPAQSRNETGFVPNYISEENIVVTGGYNYDYSDGTFTAYEEGTYVLTNTVTYKARMFDNLSATSTASVTITVIPGEEPSPTREFISGSIIYADVSNCCTQYNDDLSVLFSNTNGDRELVGLNRVYSEYNGKLYGIIPEGNWQFVQFFDVEASYLYTDDPERSLNETLLSSCRQSGRLRAEEGCNTFKFTTEYLAGGQADWTTYLPAPTVTYTTSEEDLVLEIGDTIEIGASAANAKSFYDDTLSETLPSIVTVKSSPESVETIDDMYSDGIFTASRAGFFYVEVTTNYYAPNDSSINFNLTKNYKITVNDSSAIEPKTVYFINSGNWENVYAYMWGKNGDNSWPGEAMTYEYNTPDNQFSVYSYTYTADGYDNIIFSNGIDQSSGGIQSPDLAVQNDKYYDYATDMWYDSPSDIYDVKYTDKYLCGYINGADYAYGTDDKNLGEYKFVDGTVTVDITQDSYVIVRDEDLFYMKESYSASDTSAFLGRSDWYNYSEKLYVPAGVRATFTLSDDDPFKGSCTLSYTAAALNQGDPEINDLISTTFVPEEKDDNYTKFGLSPNTVYSGLDLLGVQLKGDGSNSLRFVSVVSTDLLERASDYGYVFTSTDKDTQTAKENSGKLTTQNGHVYSCYGTFNTMTSGYGDTDLTSTGYKYVTGVINDIDSDTTIVARFYLVVDGITYYSDYKDATGATYSGCAAKISEIFEIAKPKGKEEN